jgi:hypothetical protein
MLSAVAVLLLPGNEQHRDQIVRSMTAAYSNAGSYCIQNRDICDRVSTHIQSAATAVAREAATAVQRANSIEPATVPDKYDFTASQYPRAYRPTAGHNF